MSVELSARDLRNIAVYLDTLEKMTRESQGDVFGSYAPIPLQGPNWAHALEIVHVQIPVPPKKSEVAEALDTLAGVPKQPPAPKQEYTHEYRLIVGSYSNG